MWSETASPPPTFCETRTVALGVAVGWWHVISWRCRAPCVCVCLPPTRTRSPVPCRLAHSPLSVAGHHVVCLSGLRFEPSDFDVEHFEPEQPRLGGDSEPKGGRGRAGTAMGTLRL